MRPIDAERERLIELIEAPNKANTLRQHGEIKSERPSEILADYLLDHGVLCPPCKVGDTVYIVRSKVKKCDVVYIGLSADKKCNHINFNEYYTDGKFMKSHIVGFEEIGRYVFLTREEAEKALKVRDNDA